MLLIQFTGLCGVGKTTLAYLVKEKLLSKGYKVEVIDGDEFRKHLCKDLTFSKEDREENIRRLGIVSNILARNGIITLLAAINPYETIRKEIREYGNQVKTVWINCELDALIQRDTKGLYKRAMLPSGHPNKLNNLTGINNTYDIPLTYDILIDTTNNSEATCTTMLTDFILLQINSI
jgi:adenylylsulfate kinase